MFRMVSEQDYQAEMMTLRVPVDIGDGPPIVLFHGFGMSPTTYLRTAELLARRARVVIPDLFALQGPWRYGRVLGAFVATLDRLELERVTLIGHSFGGALELGFAAAFPDRVVELVFSDTLAVSREWGLADEATRHPLGLLRLATPAATFAFARSCIEHPRQLAGAGWWAFVTGREGDIGAVAATGIRSHVLSAKSRLDPVRVRTVGSSHGNWGRRSPSPSRQMAPQSTTIGCSSNLTYSSDSSMSSVCMPSDNARPSYGFWPLRCRKRLPAGPDRSMSRHHAIR